MDNIHAAIGIEQLKKINDISKKEIHCISISKKNCLKLNKLNFWISITVKKKSYPILCLY